MTAAKVAKEAAAPSHPSLAAALAAFQAELPRVGRDNTAQVRSDKGNYTYRYADLSEVSAVVLPLLGKHGLSWSTRPTLTGGGIFGAEIRFVLAYSLSHISGETIEGTYPLPDPRSSPQVLGSALTYARRYALCAVVGVAPGDDDDDAAAAQERASQREERPKPAVRPRPVESDTPAATLPQAAADAARRVLRDTVDKNGWDVAKVSALYSDTHDGADIREATARDVESFRKGLFARPDHELRAEEKVG